ncbi:hypothetical protein F0562_027799 [Nyssa sinensis]|uniref:Uncharacterized protein n=1 Tax=Nyssa sinensis TaxID=561372 RepID=A0A5J5BAG7_9ASTE|nr:hypothetical protein F0562_027799 [Nyssa sinensis]
MSMKDDILLQAGLILFTVSMFLLMYGIPQKAFSKLRRILINRSDFRAKRHFIRGAQLLAQARSAKDSSAATTLAKSAAEEADRAIAIDPKDAAAHILKALSLELQGFKTSALDSLDVALSPFAAKSLSDRERGDALSKRAELKLALARSEQVDSAVMDLVNSVKLRNDNPQAFYLLGECYETKGMVEEARKAYEDALKVEPRYIMPREALGRLGIDNVSPKFVLADLQPYHLPPAYWVSGV